MQGYAYILTHPGTPTVFWDHVFEWKNLKDPILRLMQLRVRCGLNCRSEVKIQRAEGNLYAACVGDSLMMKIGPGHWEPDMGQWQMAESGPEWAVWTRRQ